MLLHPRYSVPSINALSLYLREPRRRVETLLAKHERLQRQLDFKRDHLLPPAQLRFLAQSFRIPDQTAYARLLADDGRSRIIAAFHLGDYVYGMNALVASVPHRGQVRVLSQRAASAAHWKNISHAFEARVPGAEAELLVDDTAPAELSALLRGRGNTLLLFCDPPAGNGARVRVRFLGRDAWFPRGAATLAVMNRVPLLPVICIREGQCNQVTVLPQLESAPRSRQGETTAKCIQRITQALVTVLEEVIVQAPEQWRYLPTLPLYFVAPGTASTSASVSAAGTQHTVYKESCYDTRTSNFSSSNFSSSNFSSSNFSSFNRSSSILGSASIGSSDISSSDISSSNVSTPNFNSSEYSSCRFKSTNSPIPANSNSAATRETRNLKSGYQQDRCIL